MGRRTVGRGCPGSYGKTCQEFLPSIGLVTGESEGDDGQDREGVLKELLLKPQEELELDKSKVFCV